MKRFLPFLALPVIAVSINFVMPHDASALTLQLARECTPVFGLNNCPATTPTPVPSTSVSPTPRPSLLPTLSPTPVVSVTPVVSPTVTPRPTVVPGVIASSTPQPSATPRPTPAATPTPTPVPAINPLSSLVLAFGAEKNYPTTGLSAQLTRALVLSGAGSVALGLLVLLIPSAWFARLHMPTLALGHVGNQPESAKREAKPRKTSERS